MTHPDPDRSDRPEPKRTSGFNGVVVALVLVLCLIAGAYVWTTWSVEDDSAADYARGHPVQPAEVPPPDAGTLSPEGKEAAGIAPAER